MMMMITASGEILDVIPGLDKSAYLGYSISGCHVGIMVMPVLSTYLYTVGGFMLPSAVAGLVSLTPLFCLPRIARYIEEGEEKGILDRKDLDHEDEQELGVHESSDDLSFVGRYLIYYLPDLVVFLMNILFQLMVFTLPFRLKIFNNIPETTSTWMTAFAFFICFVSSLFVTKISDRTNMFAVMITGTFVFYGGCFLALGYTTVYLKVWGGALLGMTLYGLAEPTFYTLCLTSKFYIYKTLGKTTNNMGETASKTWKVGLTLGAIVGGLVAGHVTTRESEVWLFSLLSGAGAVCLAALSTVWLYLRINKVKQ